MAGCVAKAVMQNALKLFYSYQLVGSRIYALYHSENDPLERSKSNQQRLRRDLGKAVLKHFFFLLHCHSEILGHVRRGSVV